MRQTLWTLVTLVSHWRRHPTNLATLLIGLAIATALWSGVQALNEQARRSYDRAAAVFGGGDARSLVSSRGGLFSQDLYVQLRLAGWKVSPVLEGVVRIGDKSQRVIGIEPLTLPRGTQLARIREAQGVDNFLKSPGQTLVSPETLLDLGETEGDTPITDRGHRLPPIKALAEAPPGVLIVDIGAAQLLLDRPDRLSRLIMNERMGTAAPPVAMVAGDKLRLVEAEDEPDLARLTESFHLNLTAFGLLAFLVGLFIVHASFGLAFEQRLPTIRTIRAVGVSARTLIEAMLFELLILTLIAGGAGLICGYLIASALLPNVVASLDELYGAQVSGRLALDAKWWVSGFGMAMLGALAAAAGGLFKTFRLPVLSIGQPLAWRKAQQRYLQRQAVFAGLGFAVAFCALLFGEGLIAGFILIAGALLGAVLLLPLVLAAALWLGEKSTSGAITQWFWADSRQQLSGLSLALMALLLALSTNIGVGTMVEGFRKTFTAWLDQRLVAEVYFEAVSNPEARRIEAWLEKRPEVLAVLPISRTQTQLAGWPVDIVGSRPHDTYRSHFPMLSATEDAWDSVRLGGGALISEQLARRLNLGIGAFVDIPTTGDSWRAEIVGVYPDYGNPKGQLRVDLDALIQHWPDAQRTTYSLRVTPNAVSQLMKDLQATFGPSIVRIVDQAAVKKLSTSIFERTFAVTAALNTLTLIVSAIALFATLLTLSNLRLAQLAPVWALGVTRRRLAWLELVKILFFAAATTFVALPFGLFLAWCLVAVVNVEAFGWRLPFHVFPDQWAQIFALSMLTAAAASIAPLIRLARTRPAELLKVFANER